MDGAAATDHGDGACGGSSGSTTPTHPPPDYQDATTSPRYQVVGSSGFTTPMSDDPEIRFRRGYSDNTDGAETTLKEVAGNEVEGQGHSNPEARGPQSSAPQNMQSPARMQGTDGLQHRPFRDEGERQSRRSPEDRGVPPRRVSSAPPPGSYQPPAGDKDWQERQRFSQSDPNARVHEEMDGLRARVGGSTTQVRADQQAGGFMPYDMGPPRHVWDERRNGGMPARAEYRANSYERPPPFGNHVNVPRPSRSYDRSRMDGHHRRSPSRNQSSSMFRPQRPLMHGRDEPAFNAGYSSQQNWHANYEHNDWYYRSPRRADNRRQQGYLPQQQPMHGSGFQPMYNPVPANKIKRPAPYDGKSSWEDYLVQFEMISEINQWNERTKALELATSLRGQAMGVLTDLDLYQRENYQTLVEALAARFEPSNTAEIYRAKLKGRVRGKTEPLAELAHSVRHLTRKAYPSVGTQVREHLALERFIEALNDAELEWFVFQAKPQTVDRALETALEFEAFKQGRRRRVGDRSYVRVQHSDPTAIHRVARLDNPCCSDWNSHSCQDMADQRLLHMTDVSDASGKGVESESQECFGHVESPTTADQDFAPSIAQEHYYCPSCETGTLARMTNTAPQKQGSASEPRKYVCFGCGIEGHMRRECPGRHACYNCGQAGHFKVDCPERAQVQTGHGTTSVGASTTNRVPPKQQEVQGNGGQLGPRPLSQH